LRAAIRICPATVTKPAWPSRRVTGLPWAAAPSFRADRRLRCAWIVYRRLLWQHADLPVMSVRDQSCGRLGLLLMAWARDRDRPGGCNRMRLDARLRDGLPVRASAREPAAGSDQLAALGGRMSSSAAPSRSLSISRGVRVSCVPYGISARDAGVEPGAEQLKRAPDRILCAPHLGCRRLAVPA
jgi:hypothetical protein